MPKRAAPDGMRVSTNGRVLALWDVRAGRVDLVDTAAPHVLRTLRLGMGCRGAGPSEASADGRWFLLADCVGNLRIADLAAASLTSTAIGVTQQGRVVIALDGAEIVWLDRGGVVHALDAAGRERTELARLEGGDPLDEFDLWYRRVVVHHATNVLAAVTGRAFACDLHRYLPAGRGDARGRVTLAARTRAAPPAPAPARRWRLRWPPSRTGSAT